MGSKDAQLCVFPTHRHLPMPNPARPTWPTNCEQLTNSIPSHTGTPGKNITKTQLVKCSKTLNFYEKQLMLNHKMTQCRAMKTLECYEQDGKSVKKDDFVKFVFLRCCEGHFHSKVVLETWQISFLVVCIIHIHQNASSQISIFSRRFYIFTSNKSPGQTGPVGKFSHYYASPWQLHK